MNLNSKDIFNSQDQSYKDIITKLKFISTIQAGDKINTNSIYIEKYKLN